MVRNRLPKIPRGRPNAKQRTRAHVHPRARGWGNTARNGVTANKKNFPAPVCREVGTRSRKKKAGPAETKERRVVLKIQYLLNRIHYALRRLNRNVPGSINPTARKEKKRKKGRKRTRVRCPCRSVVVDRETNGWLGMGGASGQGAPSSDSSLRAKYKKGKPSQPDEGRARKPLRMLRRKGAPAPRALRGPPATEKTSSRDAFAARGRSEIARCRPVAFLLISLGRPPPPRTSLPLWWASGRGVRVDVIEMPDEGVRAPEESGMIHHTVSVRGLGQEPGALQHDPVLADVSRPPRLTHQASPVGRPSATAAFSPADRCRVACSEPLGSSRSKNQMHKLVNVLAPQPKRPPRRNRS